MVAASSVVACNHPDGPATKLARSELKSSTVEMPSRAYLGRFNFKGPDQQKNVVALSGGER